MSRGLVPPHRQAQLHLRPHVFCRSPSTAHAPMDSAPTRSHRPLFPCDGRTLAHTDGPPLPRCSVPPTRFDTPHSTKAMTRDLAPPHRQAQSHHRPTSSTDLHRRHTLQRTLLKQDHTTGCFRVTDTLSFTHMDHPSHIVLSRQHASSHHPPPKLCPVALLCPINKLNHTTHPTSSAYLH